MTSGSKPVDLLRFVRQKSSPLRSSPQSDVLRAGETVASWTRAAASFGVRHVCAPNDMAPRRIQSQWSTLARLVLCLLHWSVASSLLLACTPPPKDLIEQNLDLQEELAVLLEAEVSAPETLNALEVFESESREHRRALRASIRAMDSKRREKLEIDHQDRLNDLTHRIAAAKGDLLLQVQHEPEQFRRFNLITSRF